MPAIDDMPSLPGLTSPITRSEEIAPSDAADLGFVTRAVWVGTGGNVRVRMQHDAEPITLTGVGDGTFLPMRVVQVYATGTTATGIVGLR